MSGRAGGNEPAARQSSVANAAPPVRSRQALVKVPLPTRTAAPERTARAALRARPGSLPFSCPRPARLAQAELGRFVPCRNAPVGPGTRNAPRRDSFSAERTVCSGRLMGRLLCRHAPIEPQHAQRSHCCGDRLVRHIVDVRGEPRLHPARHAGGLMPGCVVHRVDATLGRRVATGEIDVQHVRLVVIGAEPRRPECPRLLNPQGARFIRQALKIKVKGIAREVLAGPCV